MLGSLIRQYREGRSLTQERLAELAGFNHSHISRIENGRALPSRAALVRIADALDLAEADRFTLLREALDLTLDAPRQRAWEPEIIELAHLLMTERDAVAHDRLIRGVGLLIQLVKGA